MNRFFSSASTLSALPTYLNEDKAVGLRPRGNEELECFWSSGPWAVGAIYINLIM